MPPTGPKLIVCFQSGLGSFQMLLMLVAGLGLAADSVEVFVVFYILPSAEVEMCISQTEKDWMGKQICV